MEKTLLLLASSAMACNTWSSTSSNTDLCLNEPCSFNGQENACTSGTCCVGGYCQPTSNCSVAVALPIVAVCVLLGWCMFVICIAQRQANSKRELLIANKQVGLTSGLPRMPMKYATDGIKSETSYAFNPGNLNNTVPAYANQTM